MKSFPTTLLIYLFLHFQGTSDIYGLFIRNNSDNNNERTGIERGMGEKSLRYRVVKGTS